MLGITQRKVEGLPEPFDLLGVNPESSDERKYFGEIAVHFSGGSSPLFLPITEGERSRLGAALHEEDVFIQLESLDKRMVLVRRGAIADVFFSSEAYDTYGPESDYGLQHLGAHPDEIFWQIMEYWECTECLVDGFSPQKIQTVSQKMFLTDAELDELVANGNIKLEEREKLKKEVAKARDITWQITGHRCWSVLMDESV